MAVDMIEESRREEEKKEEGRREELEADFGQVVHHVLGILVEEY